LITDKRKTLGVFMNKADQNFQTTVQKVTRQCAREMGYDVFYFFTVGYRASSNFYDEQEKSMFSFVPMEALDGALVAPDTYDMHGFRESLFDMLEKRAKCPIVCVRDSLSRYDSFCTDETVAIRPLIRHLLEEHGFRSAVFEAVVAAYEKNKSLV
jgi:DNA-binding LacI/PurR family transcriptional regulator